MKKKRNTTLIRTDATAKQKLEALRRLAALEENKDVSMSELTRRISSSNSFNLVQQEIIADAKLKRRLQGRR